MIDYAKLDDSPLLDDLDKELQELSDIYKVFISKCEVLSKGIMKTQNLQDKANINQL